MTASPPIRQKIPLDEQIAEVTRQRDAFEAISKREGVERIGAYEVQGVVDRLNSAVLTLEWMKAYEPQIREFIAVNTGGKPG